MALITCPECGQKISDTAPHCIYCGYVLHPEQTSAPVKTETATARANTVTNTAPTQKAETKTSTANEPATTTKELYEEWLNEPTTHRTFANKNWKWLFEGIGIASFPIFLIFLIIPIVNSSTINTRLINPTLIIFGVCVTCAEVFLMAQRLYVRTSLAKWLPNCKKAYKSVILDAHKNFVYTFRRCIKDNERAHLIASLALQDEQKKKQYIQSEILITILSAISSIVLAFLLIGILVPYHNHSLSNEEFYLLFIIISIIFIIPAIISIIFQKRLAKLFNSTLEENR